MAVKKEVRNESFKDISISDSNVFSNFQFDLNDDNLVIYNVPVIAQMVQEYDDGFAFKPEDVIKQVKVEQIPLTLVSDSPSHPDAHLDELETEGKARVIVGFMTEPSKPRVGQSNMPKRYADFVIQRTPKTKALIDNVTNKKSIDTSIGFKFDKLNIAGMFNGKPYDYIQSNIKLDHNALLIDATGRQGVGKMPNPIGGIGADSDDKKIIDTEVSTMSEQDLQKQIDELKKEKDDAVNKLAESKEQSDSKYKELEKKMNEQNKNDADLKSENDRLKTEMAEYKSEREKRVNDAKAEILKTNPNMKKILDSADYKLVLEYQDELNKNKAKNIGADMFGPGAMKPVNDQNDKTVNNYFGGGK